MSNNASHCFYDVGKHASTLGPQRCSLKTNLHGDHIRSDRGLDVNKHINKYANVSKKIQNERFCKEWKSECTLRLEMETYFISKLNPAALNKCSHE